MLQRTTNLPPKLSKTCRLERMIPSCSCCTSATTVLVPRWPWRIENTELPTAPGSTPSRLVRRCLRERLPLRQSIKKKGSPLRAKGSLIATSATTHEASSPVCQRKMVGRRSTCLRWPWRCEAQQNRLCQRLLSQSSTSNSPTDHDKTPKSLSAIRPVSISEAHTRIENCGLVGCMAFPRIVSCCGAMCTATSE